MKVSMTVLFPACVEVLIREMRPMHFGDLTERALDDLGVKVGLRDLRKLKEDVREKLLGRGRYGTAYIGEPDCVGVMRHWFPAEQTWLLNPDAFTTRIPGSASAALRAAEEAVMRAPHMVQKNASVPPAIRWKAQARGLTIEHHVSPWFRRRWPEFYLPPTNEHQYHLPCDHDFRLLVAGRTYKVDVMGPLRDGNFGLPPAKRPVDLHVLASVNGADIVMHGFVRPHQLVGGVRVTAVQSTAVCTLAVWLNCHASGRNYGRIMRALAA